MPGQQNTILFEMKGAAAGALGADSPSGVNTDAAKDGTNKESSSFFKKMKNVPKQIASFSKSSLGVQFSLAAMLRQSQIATGFLSAMFQVLGAIVDSFLVAFAPTLFSAIAGMSKLIPVARKTGELMVGSVNEMREKLAGIWKMITPMLKGAWEAVRTIASMVMGMPQWTKNLFLIALVTGKLLAFMQVKYFVQMGAMMLKTMIKVNRVTGGGAKGMAGMAGVIGAVVGSVIALAGGLVWSFFSNKGKNNSSSGGVDVSGQLGKKYMPGSRGGIGAGSIGANTLAETFVKVAASATPVADALGRTAIGMDQTVDLYKGTAGKISDKVQAWLDASRNKNAKDLPTLPKPSGGGGRLTNIDGSTYSGNIDDTIDKPSKAIMDMVKIMNHEQRNWTELQRQHNRNMLSLSREDIENRARQEAELRHLTRNVDEGF